MDLVNGIPAGIRVKIAYLNRILAFLFSFQVNGYQIAVDFLVLFLQLFVEIGQLSI